MVKLALSAFLLTFPALGSASQYECTSVKHCSSPVGCEQSDVRTSVSISKEKNELVFGVGETAPRYTLHPNSDLTLYAGTSQPYDKVAAASFVIFRNMDFVLTSTVQIEDNDKKVAVGILVLGYCEKVIS